MEDASGEDLDWFWRGWFYGTDACDIALDSVRYAKADYAALPSGGNRFGGARRGPKVDKPAVNAFEDISKIRNRENSNIKFYTDKDLAARDFYWKYDRGLVEVDTTLAANATSPARLPMEEFTAEEKAKYADKFFYELNFSNKGGLVMPVIVEFTFKDGTKSIDRIPAQIWRLNEQKASKFYVKDKEVASIKIDPMRETADIDETNNVWGAGAAPSKFQLFKMRAGSAPARGQSTGSNPMQLEKKGE
jgi:hypothetical protein